MGRVSLVLRQARGRRCSWRGDDATGGEGADDAVSKGRLRETPDLYAPPAAYMLEATCMLEAPDLYAPPAAYMLEATCVLEAPDLYALAEVLGHRGLRRRGGRGGGHAAVEQAVG
jgi:hypothetical protein